MDFRPSLLMLACAVAGCGGADGGTAAVSGTAPGGSGVSGAAPTLQQMNSYQTMDAANENDSSVSFKSPTQAGHAIWVAVTVSDFGGIHPISISDTQGNSFTQLDQQNDGPPGSQTVAHFYAGNILGDTAAPDTIMVDWAADNYKGILIAEIAGVTAAPLVGHSSNIQDGAAVGADSVDSGAITVGSSQAPALLVAVSMNTSGGTSDTGGSGAAGPAAGSGMTSMGALWDWGQNLATFVTAPITGAQSASAVFTPPDIDSYVTVAAVFH